MTNRLGGRVAEASFIHDDYDLTRALKALVRADPRLAEVLAVAGEVRIRKRPANFSGLVAIVTSQQLSTASAAAIFGRMREAFDPFTPEAVLRARAARLQRIGLSQPKIRTVKAIARAIRDGVLDLDALANLPADEAHNALLAVHGIGPWTADIYLLFCLGHADAWPAGDLALQEAARLAFGFPARPSAKEMVGLAETWRPWRGVAAKLLWAYYRAAKGREGAPAKIA